MKRKKRIRKEEVITYSFIALVFFVMVIGVYYFGEGLTGFAVYQQSNQTIFDEGTYTNTEYNGSAVVLSENNLTGTYTSKIFDAGADATWNNLTKVQNTPSVENLYALDDDRNVFESTDYGISWITSTISSYGKDSTGITSNSSGTFFTIADNKNDVYGSADYGVTWVSITSSAGFADNARGIAVDSGDNIYVLARGKRIYKSTDSGANWSLINDSFSDGNTNSQYCLMYYENALYTIDDDKAVYKSTNSGATWTKINLQYDDANKNCLGITADNFGNFFIIDADKKVHKSTDSGATWARVTPTDAFADNSRAIVSDSSGNLYVSARQKRIYKSTDSGANWVLINDSYSGSNTGDQYGMLEIDKPTNLSFQIRNCSSSDCSDGTWQNVNLNNLNLQSRYFQYKINFSSPVSGTSPMLTSVTVDYDLINLAPTINLIEPQNILYLSNENLLLNFTVTDSDGNLDSCWYNIDGGVNVSLSICVNTTFSTTEGSHTLYLYANDSLGLESSDSASFDIDATGVSISIVEPTGNKIARTGIPITYTTIGNGLICWYNVKTSIGGAVIENTTLANCTGSSFSVSNDGDYVLNLYVNNTLGSSDLDSSSFSVDTSGSSSSSSPVSSSSSDGGGGGGGGDFFVVNKLEFSKIPNIVANPGDTKKLKLHIKNIGTNFLNECKIKASEKFSSWISSDELKNLAAGEESDFNFDLNILDDMESGKYTLELFIECKELEKSVDFVVEIIEQKLLFELVKVERISNEEVRVVYSLEELSGIEQEVELQFLLLGSSDEKAAEVKETNIIPANSQEEFEILIPVDSSLEGELNLLVNLNSETYSTFVQENIILGSPISGFSVFGDASSSDNIISGVFILLFLVFAFFMIRRILRHRKKTKK